MPYRISIIDEKNPGKVKEELSLDSLTEVVAASQTYRWSPNSFRGDARSAANFISTELLVLDVDEGPSINEALDLFKDYQVAIVPTKSHQKEKNGKVTDRYRVIIPLDYPIIDQDSYSATYQEALKRWPFADKACKDAARFYYPGLERWYQTTGRSTYTPSVALNLEANTTFKEVLPSGQQSDERGELAKATLEFLAMGAAAGTRHAKLVKAVFDMKEQGYPLNEIFTMIDAMTFLPQASWTQGGLNEKDRATIEDVFSRPHKYGMREKDKPAILGVKASELMAESLEYLRDKEAVKGDPTGFKGLDKMLGGGFRTGELTALMASAKTGKNALYHFLMYKMLCQGHAIGYASRELSPSSEVIPNLLSIATGTNMWKADISKDQETMLNSLVDKWPLHFAPGYGYMPLNDVKMFLSYYAEQGVKHFFIDHLHYMLQTEDYESTSMLIKEIKTLTKELDIHVNLIIQPRALREGEKLSLATLRGGAAIGQAIDNLLILERVRGETNASKLTLEVARHRLARPSEIYLRYDAESTHFEEVEKESIQPQSETQAYIEGVRHSRRGVGMDFRLRDDA